ncbi:hypothetical protein AB5N19_01242 [Seiridium cardinale]
MQSHEQPTSATSNATNRTNRGGRPKEWRADRTRRLTRLYCYTSLRVDEILKVLEEEVWSPGKEAANKHLNHLLGKDPRWMRPKDVTEQRQRMAGLKNSERGRSASQSSSISHAQSPMSNAQDPSFQHFQRTETMDTKSFERSSGSSIEKRDVFMFGQTPPRTTTTTFRLPPTGQHNASFDNPTNSSHPTFSRYFPGVGRQGTSMTTSTNFSVGSSRESYNRLKQKLHEVNGYAKSDVKDIFRLLKRFTISNEGDVDQSAFSPGSATGAFHHPPITNFRGQTEGVIDTSIAKYSLPGDFMGTKNSVYESISGKDQLGNTIYHFLASSELDTDNLIGLIASESTTPSAVLNATNTGGQTFLHVLHEGWFREDSRLAELVMMLRERQFNFYATDAYGRTFFHILRQNIKANSGFMREITSQFTNISVLNRRDAFGVKPMILRASTIPINRDEARPSHLSIPRTTDRTEQKIKDHAALLKIIVDANATQTGHATEDSQGRNALHCLSEVILGTASIDAHANGTKVSKRKMDANDEPIPQTCPLSQRLQYLETVLQAKVDVNHYNASGDTVLMSFVAHIIDGQDDKDLELLIKRLITAGANLEARNRSGETVLQVAARLGQKFAVKVLLDQGANFHVRNCDGRSVLQTIDDHTRLAGEYPEQLARLEATRGVLTGRFSKFQALQEPSLLQEWSVRQPASPRSA